MKVLFALSICYLPFLLNAQQESGYDGIRFEKKLSWNDIMAKARAENKYIFVDCFATWCGPCKVMDETVYPLETVGKYYNSHFISVKVQIDKTNKDDEFTRQWYNYAALLQSRYSVKAFPTFLFFSPDGTPTHKVTGSVSPDKFIELAKDAQNPDKQYYQVLKNFQPGKLDTSELKGLAKSFIYSDTLLAGEMALDYLNRIPFNQLGTKDNLRFMQIFKKNKSVMQKTDEYINSIEKRDEFIKTNLSFLADLQDQEFIQRYVVAYIKSVEKESRLNGIIDLMLAFRSLPEVKLTANKYITDLSVDELYGKENIRLISGFTTKNTDRGFNLFYHHAAKIDLVMENKGFAKRNVDRIITKEQISPILDSAKSDKTNPDWEKISAAIKNKYGKKYAENNVAYAKPAFYMAQKDTARFAKYLVEFVNKFALKESIKKGASGINYLNEMAWRIFLYSKDKMDLQQALRWSEIVTKDSVNTSYRSYIDTKATLIYKLNYLFHVGSNDLAISLEETTPYPKTIEKMKKGLPIW